MWCGPAPCRPRRTPGRWCSPPERIVPSSLQLPVWLSRSGADVLKSHPIVSVDRRGIGMSSPVDCRDLFDRQEMRDQAQFESGDDPVANLGAITMTATTSCTDTIAPGDSAYDNAHAAEDIERLRSTWDVPTLALIGRRQRRPGRAGLRRFAPGQGGPAGPRLPAPARHHRRGRDRGTGQGPAGRAGRLRRAVRRRSTARSAPTPRARSTRCSRRPARATGPAVSSVAVLANAIVTALGYPSGDRIGSTVSLANALAAARSGDANPLNNLINQAETMRDSRRPVRQLLQRRAEPADPRPGARTRGRLGQAVPAVRHGRGARTW